MALQIASLNSGSNGNCYYVGSLGEAVLIDAGITCRETENRMERLGLSFENVRAIFISHEHTDHTRGVEVISRRYNIPVYLTANTHGHSKLNIETDLVRLLIPNETVTIGELRINAFPKRHDAIEPHSFTITGGGVTIGVLTDIGSACKHVIQNFRVCNAVFLEANYDETMLDEGSYPVFLKNRIKSDHGHLSNLQALDLFTRHRHSNLSHLLLSHLSKDNNDPRRVLELFRKYAGNTKIEIASRYEETQVYTIAPALTLF